MGKTNSGYFKPTHRFAREHIRVIGWKAALVYLVLLSHAQGKKWAFPSEALMARELGISEKSVSRAVQQLVDAGDIVVLKREHTTTLGRNNRYLLRDRGWFHFDERFGTDSPVLQDLQSVKFQTHGPTNEREDNKTRNKGISLRKDIQELAKLMRPPP